MATDLAAEQRIIGSADDILRSTLESATNVDPSRNYDILSLLDVPLPLSPSFYDSSRHKLSSTKSLTDVTLKMPRNKRLERLIYAPNMLDGVEKNERESIEFPNLNGSGPYGATLVTHALEDVGSGRHAPPVIFSEEDVAKIVEVNVFDPVIDAARVLLSRSISPGTQDPEYPYLVSCSKTEVIPDRVLWHKSTINGETVAKMALSIEYKSERVLQKSWKSSKEKDQGHNHGHIFSALQENDKDCFPVGCAIKFAWSKDTKSGHNDVLTRVLVQIWLEMDTTQTDKAILTSYDSTIFFVKRSNTLYFSPTYRPTPEPGKTSNLRLGVYCFVKYALGHYNDSDIDLPVIKDETRGWPPVEIMDTTESFGVVQMTLCSSVLSRKGRGVTYPKYIDGETTLSETLSSGGRGSDRDVGSSPLPQLTSSSKSGSGVEVLDPEEGKSSGSSEKETPESEDGSSGSAVAMSVSELAAGSDMDLS
ncbi:hypothetical protein BDY19DRAFT_997508 [Irpex rosettiformis]|uniref:Uncharacterized protein n=1 Tax=Irpex rosettiformis TaxID=378272 RepID=A0ACB8TRK1_9APHY|nr:hypothetical protein BDY19DRAFT_997508 [Irpex rosettiformis]